MEQLEFEDSSILIGYSSLPIGEEISICTSFKNIFKKYKDGINTNITNKDDVNKIKFNNQSTLSKKELDDFNQNYYKPLFYYIFGKFDLAIISLIDSFQFGLGNFRQSYKPADTDNDQVIENVLPFNRQVSFGPILKNTNQKSFITTFKSLLNRKINYPLISITQIKLNDILILSYGIKFLKVTHDIIYSILDADKKKVGKCYDFLLIGNYAWNEFNLLIFSNEYDLVLKKLLEIRNLTSVNIDFIETNSYLIENTTTSLGFDFEIYKCLKENDQDCLGKKLLDHIVQKELQIRARWRVKPNKLEKVIEIFKNFEKNENFNFEHTIDSSNLVVGRGDIIFPSFKNCNSPNEIKFSDFLFFLCKIRSHKNIKNYIIDVSTFIYRSTLDKELNEIIDIKGKLSDKEEVKINNDIISLKDKLKLKNDEINDFLDGLQNLLIPDILKKAVRSIITIYNNGIYENLTFSNFIDLHQFMKALIRLTIEENINIKKTKIDLIDLEDFQIKIDRIVHSFFYAYYNRIHSSYLTGEIYDFNIFFDGGIHQLLTSFAGLHRTISKYFGNENNFLYVEGDPEFSTSGWALRLNFFHLFNPEKLASVIFQEVLSQAHLKFEETSPELFIFHSHHKDAEERITLLLAKNDITEKTLIKYNLYFEYITPILFEHIFSEIVSYKLFYLANHKLYNYWSYGYYSTNSLIYHIESGKFKINEEKFIEFLIRQLIVTKICSPEEYTNLKLSFSGEYENLFNKHVANIKGFIDNILDLGDIHNWFNWVIKFSEELSIKIYKNTIKDYKITSTNAIKIFKNNLKNGEVINYDIAISAKNNNLICGDFIHIQQLLYAYLELLKELSKSNLEESESDKNNLLERIIKQESSNEGGIKPGYKFNTNDSEILFDPTGGIFIVDFKLKKELLKIRSAFHFSLWDFAQKEKWKYISSLK